MSILDSSVKVTQATPLIRASPAPRHACGPRTHPWAEIEAVFIRGEEQKKHGRDGHLELVHEWPTQAALARRYGLRREQISRRFTRLGTDGMTVHQRQEAFRTSYYRQLDGNILRAFAGREIRLRLATLAVAEFAISQIGQELARPQGADSLLRLMTAAKKAQALGMEALRRPAEEPEGGSVQGTDDWRLMRDVMSGIRMVPKLDPDVLIARCPLDRPGSPGELFLAHSLDCVAT